MHNTISIQHITIQLTTSFLSYEIYHIFLFIAFLDGIKTSLYKKMFQEKILYEFMNFGGVRLEDDVIVNENDCELITKVPRTIEEIETLMLSD